jgi:uncharacterized membrane protein
MGKPVTKRKSSNILAGLFAILPLFLTVYIINLIFKFLSKFSAPFLKPTFQKYIPAQYSNFVVFVSSIMLTLLIIWVIGFLVSRFVGKKFLRLFECLIDRIPLIKNLYFGIRKLLDYFNNSTIAFRQVVLVEFPRKGVYSVGFLTSETWQEIQTVTPEDVVNVFVPTTPNPTTGFLIMIPRKEVIHLTMSVEEAVFFIMSGGIVTPGSQKGINDGTAETI